MTFSNADLQRLAAARLWAARRAPYLAGGLFATVPVAAPGANTIAVDPSWRLHADPVRLAGLDVPALGKLLIHLVGHLVRDHADRAVALCVPADRASWWQRCADAEINDDLLVADLLPAVAADLPVDLGGTDGGLAESYYALEDAPADSAGAGQDCGSGADGRRRPWDDSGSDAPGGLSADESERVRRGVAEEIRRSAERDPGSVPAGWLRWAETVLRSRTDWRTMLAAEIRRAVAAAAGSVDYTYRRPSRRSHTPVATAERAVLPSLFRPLPEVAIVCDTSGSMDQQQLQQILAEVEAIVARTGLRAHGVTTLAVDVDVQDVRRVRRSAEVTLAGGGGTDMGIGLAAALARRPRPEVVVVLTDGFTPWPWQPPRGARVVVGLIASPFGTPETPPPWARTVRIEGSS